MYDSFGKKANCHYGRIIWVTKGNYENEAVTPQGHYHEKEFTIHLVKRKIVVMAGLFREQREL